MRRRPFRACLSVLLVFTLLGMLPPRAVMAMPMTMQGATQQVPMKRDMGQMADHVSLDLADSHNSHRDQCPCDEYCGLCGACHSTLSSAVVSSFTGMSITPPGPKLSSPGDVYLSPDPHPPRA